MTMFKTDLQSDAAFFNLPPKSILCSNVLAFICYLTVNMWQHLKVLFLSYLMSMCLNLFLKRFQVSLYAGCQTLVTIHLPHLNPGEQEGLGLWVASFSVQAEQPRL